MNDELARRFLGVFDGGIDPVSRDLIIVAAAVLAVSGVGIAALKKARYQQQCSANCAAGG